MQEQPPKKKFSLSKKQKRIVYLFVLLLGLPVVLLGALTSQNTRQNASEVSEKPNILVFQVDEQAAETLSAMPQVRSKIGGQGVTFTQAFSAGNLTPFLSAYTERLANLEKAQGYDAESLSQTGSVARLADQASDFVKSAAQPFYLSVTMTTSRPENQHCNLTVSPDAAVNEQDVSDKPAFVRAKQLLNASDAAALTDQKQQTLCTLQAIDTAVGQVVDALGVKHSQTLIMYTAANGYSWYEHRLSGTECLYDSCRQVPLVVSYPAITTGARTSSEVMLNTDAAVTIADMSGTSLGVNTEARSLKPTLTDTNLPLREAVHFSVLTADPKNSGKNLAFRTKDFAYYELPTGEKEFYDIAADPLQLTNQITNQTYQSEIRDLATKLHE